MGSTFGNFHFFRFVILVVKQIVVNVEIKYFFQNFFRRAVVHNLNYECKIGQENCSVQAGHRPRCQYCRMKKCRDMGMKARVCKLLY